MSGSSSVAAMKKVVQQLRLEAGLNRVKVCLYHSWNGSGKKKMRGYGRQKKKKRQTPSRTGHLLSPSLGIVETENK
ncbi:guanine nucleotide-binding protein G(I)/G(S)/G(O) subunit gamma-5 isoform X1 [Halichoerus grypus]